MNTQSSAIRHRPFAASIRLLLFVCLFPLCGWMGGGSASVRASDGADTDASADKEFPGDRFLSNTRQITFEGLRSGEGYFSSDGNRMIFQSERDPANPFYQIYLSNLTTGDVRRITGGTGKTTCAWIHPDGDRVMYASTHADPTSVQQQKDRLQLRAAGKEPRYSWDYDPAYEIYEQTLSGGGQPRALTDTLGYDAEGAYSPDGKSIVFASNRRAYSEDLNPRDRQQFELDPAYMMDIYLMDADGTNVRQLTDVEGYDGGPFFSADGSKICWRRFAPDGATAEIYVMDRDGSNPRRLTNLNKMSWAPFFHPSGEYLIFTTNELGFSNFELFLVRADGSGDPVRVTGTDGFDGLPVFLPGGDRISWTSVRGDANKKRSQIYLADWDHGAAREALSIGESPNNDLQRATASEPTGLDDSDSIDVRAIADEAIRSTSADYRQSDLIRHVDYLTRPELGGRLTGTEGEKRATAYVAAYLESLGFLPAGDNGTFFHEFEFPAGSSIDDASMTLGDRSLRIDEDFRPLAFSDDGAWKSSEIVFAGYGLQVPASEGNPEYDSYVHLNVTDRIVMVLRDLPQDITPELRQQMARYGSPRRKASVARDLGAKGILFVAGPTSKVNNQLIRFDTSASSASVSLAAASISDAVASEILASATPPVDLQTLQQSLDDGAPQMGFTVFDTPLTIDVSIQRKRGIGRNVIARLPAGGASDAGDAPVYPLVIAGAHIDHLGRGDGGGSLATGDDIDQIHFGADDNASGVAALLEMAQAISAEIDSGSLRPQRDLVLAAWSGEELGLFGSQAFIRNFSQLFPDAPVQALDADAARAAAAHGVATDAPPMNDSIGAYLNLDMVGRLEEKLIVQGIGSSPKFDSMVRRRNVPVGLALSLDKTSTRLPTDASAFVSRDVPIISMFTGAHEDYHTPADTADKLNYPDLTRIAKLGGLVLREWLTTPTMPRFELNEGDAADRDMPRVNLTAYLGTIPDYVAGPIKGLKLSGVAKDGPADQAGLASGDIIVRLAGKTIEGIYDYTYAIEALKIGEEVEVVVQRGEKTVTLRITPGSRD